MTTRKPISRRGFLRIIALGGVAGMSAKVGADRFFRNEPVTVTRLLMGTMVNLTVVSQNYQYASAAISHCLEHMTSLEAVLSRFQPNSQVSCLNQNGALASPHPVLLELITSACEISRLTGGAFDISIKPLVDLYRQYQTSSKGLPPANLIQETLDLVNYHAIHLSGNQIHFAKPGMTITLDGIAKGYIVDQGVAILRAHGFSNVVIEAGGDLLASGQKSTHQHWTIGINSPRKSGSVISRFDITDKAVATSGDYMQPFVKNCSQHHILDPRTGYSAPDLASVSVIGPSACLADGLATAIMVLGLDLGKQLLARLSNYQAYLVTKNLEEHFVGGRFS